jgi:hypothetical protein
MSHQPMDPRELAKKSAVDAALALAAADRDQLLDMLAEHKARPVIRQHQEYRGFLRRWHWFVEDETSGRLLAVGWALTERACIRRKFRAYLRELHASKTEATR